MGIFKEPPKRDKQYRLLMTAEEKDALDSAARRYGMQTSELIRAAINDYIERRDRPKKSKRPT